MPRTTQEDLAKLRENQPLFIGVYPAGLVYADRTREKNGDYLRLGFLSYSTLELTLSNNPTGQILQDIKEHAATMQARKGEQFSRSTCGSFITLGE